MSPVTTVLLAFDGSDIARDAITRAVGLLGSGHRFLALSVVPPAFVPATPLSPMDAHPTLSDPELEEQVEDEEEQSASKALAALVQGLGVEAEPHVVIGEPGPTICDVAEQLDVELVVIGSHGHGWLRRVFLGSASEHVLHHAPCPVLVVRHAEAPTPDSD